MNLIFVNDSNFFVEKKKELTVNEPKTNEMKWKIYNKQWFDQLIELCLGFFYYHMICWKKRGDPGIEPGTSCTLNKNHTTRPIAHLNHLPFFNQFYTLLYLLFIIIIIISSFFSVLPVNTFLLSNLINSLANFPINTFYDKMLVAASMVEWVFSLFEVKNRFLTFNWSILNGHLLMLIAFESLNLKSSFSCFFRVFFWMLL